MDVKKLHDKLDRWLIAFKIVISFIVKIIFISMVLYGIYCLSVGTTFTNEYSLKQRVPESIAKLMAIGLTIAFCGPALLQKKPIWMVAMSSLLLLFSSTLAINTMTAKKIEASQERIGEDPLLDYYKKQGQLYAGLSSQKDENYSKAADEKTGWSVGARHYREDSKLALQQSINASELAQRRIESLSEKGSVQEEAFVETWSYLIPALPKKKISIFSDLLFSLLNDLGLIGLYFVLVSFVPQLIIQPKQSDSLLVRIKKFIGFKTENKINDNDSVGGLGNRSEFSVEKSSTESSIDRSKESSTGVQKPVQQPVQKGVQKGVQNGVQQPVKNRTRERISIEKSVPVVKSVLNEYKSQIDERKITLAEIGKIAASRIGKKKAFKKSFICGVKNGKYNQPGV